MRKWQVHCQVIFKHFTKRFVKEYLLALQYSSHKNCNAACSLRVGDPVLIKEDIIPSWSWKRGVVNQLITGHNAAVRGAIIYRLKLIK